MLMKRLLSRETLLKALKQVEKNKGSHGMDGMSVESLREHIQEHWTSIRSSIEDGTYKTVARPSNRNPEIERWRSVIRYTYCVRPFRTTSNRSNSNTFI